MRRRPDPIRSLGAQLWVTELALFRNQRRFQVEGWISDWRQRTGDDATSVGFAFELEADRIRRFHLLMHGRVRPVIEVGPSRTLFRSPAEEAGESQAWARTLFARR